MNVYMYPHGGSQNHGTEAIARTTSQILKQTRLFSNVILFSYHSEQDKRYNLKDLEIRHVQLGNKYSIIRILEKSVNKLFKLYFLDTIKIARSITSSIPENSYCVSIGGDNYSYKEYIPYYIIRSNRNMKKKNCKMILWGCSIGADCLNSIILKDLWKYDLIIARESITYQNLKNVGLSNVKLYPDPAFILEVNKIKIPTGFVEGQTVGINISPMIQSYEKKQNIAYANYKNLIEDIINNSTNQIALIPHVVWDHTNDLKPLSALYEEFKNTGRVVLVKDHNSMELKYLISLCTMFVGARTHATIAAYSTCVPTLVVGYSVKARGIAKDLFGTDDNYVLPIQNFRTENDLLIAFKWLCNNKENISSHLQKVMPNYIERARTAGEEILKLHSKQDI